MNHLFSGDLRPCIVSYTKFNKLVRNYIVYTSQTLRDTQIEVFASYSDAFVDLIANCLKLFKIEQSDLGRVVPLDIISLVLDLIG